MSPDMMMNLVFIFLVMQLSIKNLFETFLYQTTNVRNYIENTFMYSRIGVFEGQNNAQ